MPIECNTRLLWIPVRKKRCRVTCLKETIACLSDSDRMWWWMLLSPDLTVFYMLQTQKADEITTVFWGSFQFLENLGGVVKKILSNFTEMWLNQFSVLVKSENVQQNSVFIITGMKRALWKLQNHQIYLKNMHAFINNFWDAIRIQVLEFWKLWWTRSLKGRKKSHSLLDFCKFCWSWLAFAVREIWMKCPSSLGKLLMILKTRVLRFTIYCKSSDF